MDNDKQAGKTAQLNTRAVLLSIALITSLAIATVDSAAAQQLVPYQIYGSELHTYVDDRGMVNYQGLKAHRKKLDEFAASMAVLEPSAYEKMTETEKIALWINAYNALTLVAIINHYPIKSSFIRSLRFPKNSIRQIPGVWDELKFTVMGDEITLDGIEHQVLRARFNEPRIHMALVCAAMGCPPLRREPYDGNTLDAQLNDQTKRFLGNPKKFRIDRQSGTVFLSPIFKWFGSDFEKTFGTEKKFSGFSETERAVLNFISGFLKPEDRAYLEKGGYSIAYLDYDWSLNEQTYAKK